MEKLPLSFGLENFDATPQKPWDKQPKTDHLDIRIDFGGKMSNKRNFEQEWGLERYVKAMSEAMPYIMDLKKASQENLLELYESNPDSLEVFSDFLMSVTAKGKNNTGTKEKPRQPTEKEMAEGIAKGFNEFLVSRTQAPWSGLKSEDILEAIKLGVRDAFEGKDISHIAGGECGILDVSVNTSIKKHIESLPKYRKYEYCEHIGCEHLDKLKSGDKIHCKMECGAYDYHDYLQERGCSIVKTGE
jgi:hypothetical protein